MNHVTEKARFRVSHVVVFGINMEEKVDKHWVEIFTLHATLFYVHVTSLAYDVQHVHVDGESMWEYKGYGGKFKYLTFITQVDLCMRACVRVCVFAVKDRLGTLSATFEITRRSPVASTSRENCYFDVHASRRFAAVNVVLNLPIVCS